MPIRCTKLRPPLLYPLPPRLALARSRFLDAANINQHAKRVDARHRHHEYQRKVYYSRRALELDTELEVIEATSFDPWHSPCERLVALRLVKEPHLGVHVPLLASEPLYLRLVQRFGGAA
jgi:hypothetical protein